MAAGDPGSPARYYSSTAVETSLQSSIAAQSQGASNTSFIVASISGFPTSYPYTLIVDPDTSKEEVLTVTSGSSTTLTVTRGEDNTQAVAHSAGAVVRHGVSGRDFRESENHIAARGYDIDATILNAANQTHVHGIATGEGVVVGTLKTQTLTNKTLTSPTISNPTITGTSGVETSIVFEGATADAHETTLTVVDPTQDNTITLPNTSGTVTLNDATQTLTNKTINGGTISGTVTASATVNLSGSIVVSGGTITGLSSAGMVSTSATPKDYVDSILGSATAAATSAASAATSASSAATSASSAATSASSALTSANSASTSATAAATSATNAATSASSASTSASSALTSANSASASETAAATSASSAATSASSALTSANSASTSATAAATSASSAATSASSALTSANSAGSSATGAAASATAASDSAAAAALSAGAITTYASLPVEYRQYAAEDSILRNVPVRVDSAEQLLKQAVLWYDSETQQEQEIPITASGYMYLPGINGNFASVPDAAALDITGDIDIRVKVALESWSTDDTTAEQILISKRDGAGSQYSWAFYNNEDGTLQLIWSAAGSTTVNLTAKSTVTHGLQFNELKWVRATLDVDNGSGGYDLKYWLSDDGTNWTQLGATITGASTTSIFNSTAPVRIGTQLTTFTGGARGKFYRAQVYNGIGGTLALDANFETAMTSQTVASFTESSTNAATVTVTRTTYDFPIGITTNLGYTGSLFSFINGTYVGSDSNSPKFLDWTGTNYVYLPGVVSNYLSVPDETAFDISGDIDIRIQTALEDWTPGATSRLVGKYGNAGNRSYLFDINTVGNLRWTWSPDGTTLNQVTVGVATGIADGATKWVRVTFDADNGAGGNDVKFWTSDDNVTYTQLGNTITTAGTATIYNSTANLSIGSDSAGTTPLTAKIYRAQVLNGINGNPVLDVDTSLITNGNNTSFTALTGQTVTINRSTSGRRTVAVTHPCWLFGTDDMFWGSSGTYLEHTGANYLYLPGVTGNYASAPDAAPLDITGDIDMRFKIALDDWTPAANNGLIAKDSSTTELAYRFVVLTTGLLRFSWSANGTTWNDISSTVAPTVTDGSTLWVRATFDVDNGASGNTVTFYTSTDGTTWTQLGDAVVTAGTTSIYSSNRLLVLGASGNGTANMMRGKFFRAQIYNGIAGTLAFDANFETSLTNSNQITFTESSANSATVTISRSGESIQSTVVTQPGYPYRSGGFYRRSTIDYISAGTNDFTAIIISRQWDNLPATTTTGSLFSKTSQTNTTMTGWWMNHSLAYIGDGTTRSSISYTAPASGTLAMRSLVRDVGTSFALTLNGTKTTGTDSTTGSLTNVFAPSVGRATFIANYTDLELYAVAYFNRALTDNEIATIYSYYSGKIGA